MDESVEDLSGRVRGLAATGASNRDICEHLGMPEEVLERDFAALLMQARAARRIALRKKQTEMAIEGSAGMLSLLGKHELGQTQAAGSDDDWPEPQLDPKVG